SLILWRIFYNPLLYAVKQIPNSSYSMQKVSDRDSSSVNHLAFVNDTVWISDTREVIEQIFSKAESFFTRNDIEINTDKIMVIHKNINDHSDPDSLTTATANTEFLLFCEKQLKTSEKYIS